MSAVILTGCASTKGYLVDRGRDAADIVTIGIGTGLGAKARLGPLQAGALLDVPQVALRGGAFCSKNPTCGGGGPIGLFSLPQSFDLTVLFWGAETFGQNEVTKLRKKDFAASMPRLDVVNKPAYWYTELEGVVALGLSVRLGINPGELLDFILGWTTLDLFNDDVAARMQEEGTP